MTLIQSECMPRLMTMRATLPSRVVDYLRLVMGLDVPVGTSGCRVSLDARAMAWHNVSAGQLVSTILGHTKDVWVLPMWENEDPVMYITSRVMLHVSQADESNLWNQELPPLSYVLRHP